MMTHNAFCGDGGLWAHIWSRWMEWMGKKYGGTKRREGHKDGGWEVGNGKLMFVSGNEMGNEEMSNGKRERKSANR